jgi:hypothetical protein
MRWQRWIASTGVAVLTLSVASSHAAAGSVPCGPSVTTPVPQPTAAHLAAAGLSGFPLAPDDRRVDLVAPPFTNSTDVTNPLFPISELRSAILNGHVDGKPLKIETTLLPDTRIVEWSPGQCVRTLVSQFVAYEGGQIKEVALDHYAQADDGSVWYFGEDVFNYEHGVVADTGGTWLAGKEGPAAMIMPGQPKVGDVNRSENIPGLVFEEVTIKETGRTVNGPRGPQQGAIVGSELHDDGTREDKFFAPGYGEFRSASPSELEAMAVAVPTDASAGPEPAQLRRILDGTTDAFRAARAHHWRAASAAVDGISKAWRADRPGGTPPRLVAPLTRALDALDRAVTHRRSSKARSTALDVAQATLDLLLRYRQPAEIDRSRFALWAQQARVDASARHRSALSGDVATLTWIRDRIARSFDSVDVVRIDHRLTQLEANVADDELRAAARTITALLDAAARARQAKTQDPPPRTPTRLRVGGNGAFADLLSPERRR